MAKIILNDSNFDREVIKSVAPVLVDFYADWCGPCKMIAPIIDELAAEFEGKLKVGKLDVDANPETSSKFQIMSIPTILLFKNGQVVKQMVGYQSKESLRLQLASII